MHANAEIRIHVIQVTSAWQSHQVAMHGMALVGFKVKMT